MAGTRVAPARTRELPDAKLNANRKRRLLQQLDKALGRKTTPAKATPAQQERRERAVAGHRDALRSYDELKRAILAHGGIRANADYKRGEIPADVYRPRGQPADEMATYLADHGLHYGGDAELMTDLHRRRDRVKDTAPPKLRRGPSIVCMDIERDASGRFMRHR